jgi:regulator of nonsense transcripts 2
MDIEFVIQDAYALTRPEWKFAKDFTEASKLFAEAVAQNYKSQENGKAPEPEDDVESSASEDGIDEDGFPDGEEEAQSSSDEGLEAGENADDASDAYSDEEEIYVTRQEEERDPEFEAEFDKAYEKMMAESLESRKFERKPMFDVPLPLRKGTRETSSASEGGEASQPVPNTMAFSLMTKRGNKHQVCPVLAFVPAA